MYRSVSARRAVVVNDAQRAPGAIQTGQRTRLRWPPTSRRARAHHPRRVVPVELGAWRQARPSSTEARRTNPSGQNRRAIPTFYPMPRGPWRRGDADTPRARPRWCKAGANPAQGARAFRARSTCLAWGVRRWRQRRPGLFGLGVRAKHPTAKSSTMNRAKALASETERRRHRTGKDRCRRVRGSFWFLPPEIVRDRRGRKRRWGGSPGRAATGPPGITGYRRDRSDKDHR